MRRPSSKETRELIKFAEGLGWEVQATRRGHYKFTRSGCGTVVISGTASDHRSIHNARAELKRNMRCQLP